MKYYPNITQYANTKWCLNATSGFGHDIAIRLDELGFTVFAGCLHPGGHGARKLKSSSSNNLHLVPLDVGNDDSVLKAHQYVVENLPPNGMYNFYRCVGQDLQFLISKVLSLWHEIVLLK